MIFESLSLGVGNAFLDIYCPDLLSDQNEAILVIPGGGYGGLSLGNEGEAIALAYAAQGLAAFVLHYSVGAQLPENCPLAEAGAAMAYIRRNAERFKINPEKLYAVGFSAGGHLCASLATLWHDEDVCKLAGVIPGENKPNAVVLCYPVISSGEHGHKPSFYNLLGSQNPPEDKMEYYSLEKRVDARSVPAFIIHTAEDTCVPVQNALLMATAYAQHGIQLELHVYPHGSHGFGLGNNITNYWAKSHVDEKYARWVDDSIYFFRHLK